MDLTHDCVPTAPVGLERVQGCFQAFLQSFSQELNDPTVLEVRSKKPIVFQEERNGFVCNLMCFRSRDYHELTGREQAVVELARKGLMNKQIAAALGMKSPTVATHMRSIFKKLRISSRTDLMVGDLAAK